MVANEEMAWLSDSMTTVTLSDWVDVLTYTLIIRDLLNDKPVLANHLLIAITLQ